jgi:hypothetical protein
MKLFHFVISRVIDEFIVVVVNYCLGLPRWSGLNPKFGLAVVDSNSTSTNNSRVN